MPATADQSRANLRSAERLAAIRLGIDLQDGSPLVTLTYEQRTAYNKAIAAIISANPDRFTPATVKTASLVVTTNYEPLQDTSFDADEFTSALADNALAVGASVASVGEGVKSALNLTAILIPAALVVGAFILLRNLDRRTAPAS